MLGSASSRSPKPPSISTTTISRTSPLFRTSGLTGRAPRRTAGRALPRPPSMSATPSASSPRRRAARRSSWSASSRSSDRRSVTSSRGRAGATAPSTSSSGPSGGSVATTGSPCAQQVSSDPLFAVTPCVNGRAATSAARSQVDAVVSSTKPVKVSASSGNPAPAASPRNSSTNASASSSGQASDRQPPTATTRRSGQRSLRRSGDRRVDQVPQPLHRMDEAEERDDRDVPGQTQVLPGGGAVAVEGDPDVGAYRDDLRLAAEAAAHGVGVAAAGDDQGAAGRGEQQRLAVPAPGAFGEPRHLLLYRGQRRRAFQGRPGPPAVLVQRRHDRRARA